MTDIVDAPLSPAPVWDKPKSKGDRNSAAWARLLARGTDGVFVVMPMSYGFGAAVGVASVRLHQTWILSILRAGGWQTMVAGAVLAIVATWIGETLLITIFRGTPGKALMGIKIARPDGRRVSLWRSGSRYLFCLVVGRAGGLPLLSIGTALVAYNRYIDRGTTIWDDTLDLKVTRHPVGWWRWGIAILCMVSLWMLTVASRLGAISV